MEEGGSKREAGLRELYGLWKLHGCQIDLSTSFLKCTETSQVWFNETAATQAVAYELLQYFSHLLQLRKLERQTSPLRASHFAIIVQEKRRRSYGRISLDTYVAMHLNYYVILFAVAALCSGTSGEGDDSEIAAPTRISCLRT